MINEFVHAIGYWLQLNTFYAIGICFLWGVCSVALSPCHFAALSLFTTPQVVEAGIKRVIPPFMAGHGIALFLVGLILCLFSYQLDILGHYWTVPFGVLFFMTSWRLLRPHQCSHSAPPSVGICGDKQSADAKASDKKSVFDTAMRYMTQHFSGFIGMGFVYGLLSGTCVLMFLSPILLLAQQQSFVLLLAFNAAFALGHTLPILIMGLLAQPLHSLSHSTHSALRFPRYGVALIVACIGFVLVAHPFLEAMGFDFHGHEHSHSHDGHEHDGHEHDGHNHDEHNHDGHNHDGHNHDTDEAHTH